jgi:hypothetical protein
VGQDFVHQRRRGAKPIIPRVAGASEPSAARAHPLPTRLAEALLLAALLFGSAWLLLALTRFELGLDQGIYAVVADAMLRGGAPYQDAWDFKPPGVYFAYALARGALGSGMASVRILEAAGVASLFGAFALLSRRFAGGVAPGLLAAALAASGHVWLGFWHTAQPESFGGVLLAWALVLATTRALSARAQVLAEAGSGALYAAAALMKPPLGGGILVSAAFAAGAAWRAAPIESRRRAALRPLVAYGVGGSLPLLLVLGYLAAEGALPDLADALFGFAPAYTRMSFEPDSLRVFLFRALEFMLFRFSLLHLVGLALLFSLPALAPREREGVTHILGVLGFVLVGVALQGRFFAYHFGAALHLVALLAGWGLWKLVRVGPRFALGPLLVAALVWVFANANGLSDPVPGGFFTRARTLDTGASRNAPLRRVAAWVAARTEPSETLYVWGFEPLLYDLAERRPASRYIYNAPQRAPWSRRGARPALIEELQAAPPAAILVEQGDLHPGTAATDTDSATELEHFPRLRALLAEGYVQAARIDRFTIHLRRDVAARRPSG